MSTTPSPATPTMTTSTSVLTWTPMTPSAASTTALASRSPPWGSDQTAPLGPWRSRAPTSTDTAAIDRPYADAAVLPVDAHTVRLFLHVLAATVWVGGQLTLA